MEAPRHAKCVFLGRLREQNDKFVSAIAECKVDQPALILHCLADLGEQLGTSQVAVGIVDVLEMVEVDKNQRKLKRVPMRTIYFGVQHEIQMPGVVQRGAIVGNGEFVNSLNVTRVFYGDRGVVRQRFQQRQISFAESFGPNTINQLDHSQALFAE